MNKLLAAISQIFAVKQHFTSSYHPQTNSVAENCNKTIIQCLGTIIDENQTTWPELLPSVLMALRMSPSASSAFSPYHLVYGKEMNISFDTALIPRENLNHTAKKHIEQLLSNLKIAK